MKAPTAYGSRMPLYFLYSGVGIRRQSSHFPPDEYCHRSTKETRIVCPTGHCILLLSMALLLGARLALDEHAVVARDGLGSLRLQMGSVCARGHMGTGMIPSRTPPKPAGTPWSWWPAAGRRRCGRSRRDHQRRRSREWCRGQSSWSHRPGEAHGDRGGRRRCSKLSDGRVSSGQVVDDALAGRWYIPAFFSCVVNSFQSTFMRSLRAIHSSACSSGAICSHRFSMSARVGLEMAWAWRACWA